MFLRHILFCALAGSCCLANESGTDRIQRLRAELSRAEAALGQGQDLEAETSYRRVLEEAGTDDRPTLLLARAVDGLADLMRSQKRLDEAIPLYRRSIELWERLLGSGQPRQATSMHNVGTIYLDRSQFDDAEAMLRGALSIWEDAFGNNSSEAENTRRALRNLARAREREDRDVRAAPAPKEP
jgi:tetratricopeptide (TPR) repeat protein